MAIHVERLIAEIDADPAKAIAALKAFEAEAKAAAKDETKHIVVDVDKSKVDELNTALRQTEGAAGGAGDAVGRVGSSAGGADKNILKMAWSLGRAGGMMGGLYTAATAVPGALAAIAGAAGGAVAALAPLGGLLGTLPVGFGALGGGIAAAVIGFSGVGQGVQAMQTKMAGAGSTMDMVTGKAHQVAMALRALRDAQHAAAQAAGELKDAEAGIATARADAIEALQQQRFTVRQAALSEEQAVLRLKQAQENLRKAQEGTAKDGYTLTKATDAFTGKQVEIARMSVDATDSASNSADSLAASRLAVKQAELDLATARDNSGDQQKKLNDMEKKGIKGSDQMVAARKRLADAQWSYKKSLEGIKDAQYNLNQARKATNGATAATNAYNRAMKNLSPTAREFVKFLVNDFLPSWHKVRDAAAEGLLPGVERGLKSLQQMFPMLSGQARGFGKVMGNAFANFWSNWAKSKNQDHLSKTMTGLQGVLRRLLRVATPLSNIMLTLTDAAMPLTNRILRPMVRELRHFDKWLSGKKGQSVLDGIFGTKKKGDVGEVYKFTRLWVKVLTPLGGILTGVVKAAEPLATWMLKNLGEYLQTVSDNINSVTGQKSLKDYFNKQKPAIRETAGALKDLAGVLFGSSKGGEDSAFVKTMKAIRKDVIPAISDLMTSLDESDFGAKFAKAVGGLARGLSRLVENDGPLTLTLDVLNGIIGAFDALSKVTGGKSADIIAKAVAAYGIYKLGRRFGGGGGRNRGGKPGIVGRLLGAGGIQNVRVVNWPRGYGRGGPGGGGDDSFYVDGPNGGDGEDDGHGRHRRNRHGRPRRHFPIRGRHALGALSGTASFLYGAPELYGIANDINQAFGGPKNFGGATKETWGRKVKHGKRTHQATTHVFLPTHLGGPGQNKAAQAADIKRTNHQFAYMSMIDKVPGARHHGPLGITWGGKGKADKALSDMLGGPDAQKAFKMIKDGAWEANESVSKFLKDLPKSQEAFKNYGAAVKEGDGRVGKFTQHYGGMVKALNDGRTPTGMAEGKTNKFGETVKSTSTKTKILNGELDTMATRVKNIPPKKSTAISAPGLDTNLEKLRKYKGLWDGLTDKQINLVVGVSAAHKNFDTPTGPGRPNTSGGGPLPRASTTQQTTNINNTFMEKVDPQHVANAIAWQLFNNRKPS